MTRISPSLAGCIGAVALLASGCSGEREQSSAADAELVRLSGALTAMQTERDLLQRENHTLRAELDRLRLAQAQPAAPVAPAHSHAAAPSLPALPAEEAAAAPAAGGSYVVVLASVGASFADQERPGFGQVAEELSRRFGGDLSAAFGLRTPRSGGLQLIYGAPGLSRAQAQQALGVLNGRYADAYILNTD